MNFLGSVACLMLGFHEVCIDPGPVCAVVATDPDGGMQRVLIGFPEGVPCHFAGGPAPVCGGADAVLVVSALPEGEGGRPDEAVVLVGLDGILRAGPVGTAPEIPAPGHADARARAAGLCPPG